MNMLNDNKKRNDLIFGYFANESSDQEKEDLTTWLKENPKNINDFNQQAEIWAVAHKYYFKETAHVNFQKLHEKVLVSEKPTKKKTIKLFPLQAIVIAASIALLIGLFTIYENILSRERALLSASFETVVPLGSRAKVILPDQSIVWLNAGSSLYYDKAFNGKTREVYLKGEGFFDITPDSLHPFIVKSNKLDIKVLGTTFNVKAYDEDETIEVVLQTGKVDVSINGDNTHRYLIPDEKLSYHTTLGETTITEVNASDFCSWVDGKVKFTEIAFTELVTILERKYDVKIIVNSRALQEDIYSGSFSSDHTIYDILNEINIEGKYVWRQEGNNFMIYDIKNE